ncbi:ISWI chromatin-remodeling complex ATPase ISW2 [Phakopsora pachyrhizi]|uniref:ISWI chromatin-remodeling complex ATPase ISW2 n=1 Tax=Phakopsora pachyrhizi TaxID=170000 RepID=A0AAV0AIQ5_PHAPC|nr:ISWI chromatin-remodeling complex ATPase ISW2 [Phakopsora pachyrhizi]CAH7667124.1 ISWI chromatin-remodeling complex ATPase ISW2 [Phakopsora pachyrhizi]
MISLKRKRTLSVVSISSSTPDTKDETNGAKVMIDEDGPPSKRTRGQASGNQAKLNLRKPKSQNSGPRKDIKTVSSDFRIASQNLLALMECRRAVFILKHKEFFLSLFGPRDQMKLMAYIQKATETTVTPPSLYPTRVTEYRSIPQPKSIKGQMKPYQLIGLSFLVHLYQNGMNGILGDEMGLGKTLQTLSLLSYLKESDTQLKVPPSISHLIICPLSVLSSWSTEVKRWTNLSCCIIQGPKAERKRLLKSITGTGTDDTAQAHYDLVICNYETYEAEVGWFQHRLWQYVVLDEGHKIKNHQSQISQSLMRLRSTNRLILTGTPVQNNLVELWCLFRWLLPSVFLEDTYFKFKDAFNLEAGKYDTRFLSQSHNLLKLLMIRRTKEAMKSQLAVPPREEITLYVPLSACQRFWTKRLLMKCDLDSLNHVFDSSKDNDKNVLQSVSLNAQANGLIKSKTIDDDLDEEIELPTKFAFRASGGSQNNTWRNLMNLLMQLRKVCDHPYLIPGSEDEPFEIAEHLVNVSSKLALLDKLLASELPKGKKVLIFSQFTKMLDILEDFLTLRGIAFLRLDGSTPRSRRNLSIRLFQQKSQVEQGSLSRAKYPVFLISTRAGGLGINLTAAETVILFESDWNPQIDIQAIARAHRIGQTKKVTVYRLICYGSVEQQMLGRIRKKLYLSLKIMNSDQHQVHDSQRDTSMPLDDADVEIQRSDVPTMSKSDLCSILRGGTGAMGKQWGKQKQDSKEVDLKDEESENESGYEEFLAASFEEVVKRAKEVGRLEEAKLNKEIALKLPSHSTEGSVSLKKEELDVENLDQRIQDEEMELLQGIERVRTQILEGKEYRRSNKEIGREWVLKDSKRRAIAMTKVVDGHVVDSRSLTNERWQAVKTITSDPIQLAKLQSPKRQKRKFDHEDVCLVCHDGGHLLLCNFCPRVAHTKCLGLSNSELKKTIIFSCTQHNCVTCGRSTVDAGGMLYKCQTCSDAYCEDCLPDENFHSVGDVLPEFLLLGFGYISQAHYIRCFECLKHFEKNPATKKLWEEEENRIQNLLISRSF